MGEGASALSESKISGSLERIVNCLDKVNQNLASLSSTNDHLVAFNDSFATFMKSIKLNADCVEFKNVDPMATIETSNQMEDVVDQENRQSKNKSNVSEKTPEKRIPPQRKRSIVKKKKSSSVSNLKRKLESAYNCIIDSLPPKYHQQPHKANIELILEYLKEKLKDKEGAGTSGCGGAYLTDIVTECNVHRAGCIEYLNLLMKKDEVLRINKKGLLYRIDPAKSTLGRFKCL
eukprot:Nk52_evm20s150 gene=Nk52_evmTU20s150